VGLKLSGTHQLLMYASSFFGFSMGAVRTFPMGQGGHEIGSRINRLRMFLRMTLTVSGQNNNFYPTSLSLKKN
jgi:hypothetical protein